MLRIVQQKRKEILVECVGVETMLSRKMEEREDSARTKKLGGRRQCLTKKWRREETVLEHRSYE
jgi:hypothetical protein